MIINISSVNLYTKCPRKWGYSVLGYNEPETAAMREGTAFHEACALSQAPPEHAPGWMLAAWEAAQAWQAAHPEVEVIGNEMELEAPFGRHTLKGRLDRIVRWNGLYWHWQWKTAAANKNLEAYTRLIARSFHEHGYRHLAIHAGYVPYGGSWLGVARKHSQAALDRGENPLFVTPLPTGSNNASLLADLETHIDAMAEWETKALAGGALPPQAPEHCGGFYGNSPCHFLDVCDGRVGLTAVAPRVFPVHVRQEAPRDPGNALPPTT